MKNFFLLLFLSSFFIIHLQTNAQVAPVILRGPYLQSPGPTSIVVRWRTDSLRSSRVYYGATLGATTNITDSTTLTTEHRVLLKGLSPRTKYYYMVATGAQILRGPDTSMYFTTAPDALSNAPVRFWVIGDFGHGNDAERKVRDSYVQYAAATKPADFQLWVGDNAYSDGTDSEYQAKVFDTMNCFGHEFLHLPFVSTSGNHDYNSVCPWQPALCTIDPNLHTGPYLNMIDPPQHGELGGVASNRKIFYSFDYEDTHFVVLNSELGSLTAAFNWLGVLNHDSAFTSPMLDWLKLDLAATTKKWKIALWHQCPYSGQDNFTASNGVQIFCVAAREHFNRTLENYGVDLVLVGHDHNYQRSFLINGHYGDANEFTSDMMINGTSGKDDAGEAYTKYTDGTMAGKGTVYLLQGNSSEGNTYSPISHPAIYWGEACDTCYGSTIIDINGDRLDGHYLTSNGVERDHFTIKKQSSTGIDEEQLAFDHFFVFPNPFREATAVGYTVQKKCFVKIDVLDVAGKIVYAFNSGSREPGSYREIIDMDKPNISSGTYFIRLDCGGIVKYRKVTRME